MQENKSSHIWFSKEEKKFFVIPDNTDLGNGIYRIQTFDDIYKNVNLASIIPYLVTEKQILEKLKNNYQEALEKTKESLTILNQFASITGRISKENINAIFNKEFHSLKENEQEPFVLGKELVQELIQNVKNTNLSEDESKEAFKSTFQKVPEILSYFEDNKLSEAANDPEAWANEMYQKLYGDIDKKRRSHEKDNLRKDIKESIAKGLRNAGIEPIEE